MNTNTRPPPELLKEYFHYDPQTGIIYWKKKSGCAKPGAIACSKMSKGYLNVTVRGWILKAHTAAYALTVGKYPPSQIDHKDGNKANNAWHNLRPATNAENQHNVGLRKDNKSGVKGVYFHNQSQKWTAQITAYGEIITLGRFRDKQDAINARHKAAIKLHKEFAKL
jgi:hypothetical protein